MNRPFNGAFPLARIFGVQIFVHWTWFLLAMYEIQQRNVYESKAWNVAELLSVFAIVILHELGHALATRSVGGQAEYVILWPLGGAAVVRPPLRPAAMLWGIAAGPLVNVVLIPLLYGLSMLVNPAPETNLRHWFFAIQAINIGLLIFNLLPIYPLDGGKILWSLLWFPLGMGQSLRVATVIGMLGAIAGFGFALWTQQLFLILIAAFAAWQCWIGFQYATAILRQEAQQRRGFEV